MLVRNPLFQTLLVLAAGFLVVYAGLIFWSARTFIGAITLVVLVLLMLKYLFYLLPWPPSIRRFWDRSDRLQKTYRSYRLSRFLWFGLGMMAAQALGHWRGNGFDLEVLYFNLALTLLGLIAWIVWRVKDRRLDQQKFEVLNTDN
mgnify:CR=1 FL=1